MSGSRNGEFDVIIVGAGVAGAALASLLVALGLSERGRVAVVARHFAEQPAATADWDLRVFALSRASERLLQICGVWDALPTARRFAYERMCVWDAAGSPQGAGSLTFDCAQIGEPNLGHIVDARLLQWHCLEACRAAGAVLIEGSVQRVMADEGSVAVRLEDGRQLSSILLAAADGVDSATRRLLGIETAGHGYLQDALVAHVSTGRAHGNTAWQRFLPSGPVAFLPLNDGRSSIVWSVARHEADRLRALKPSDFGEALTAASGEALGRCTLTTPLASFPLKLQYAVRYLDKRAVLLGDAAHVVHPLAGQGLNMGLLDCGALAQVLREAGGGAASFGDSSVLRRYERWRRSENELTAAALDGLERLFAGSGALNAALRYSALGAVARMPFAKRSLALRALGLSGDVPDFLKSEPA